MPNKNLRDFLRECKEKGPLYYMEVTRPLSPELEVSILNHKLWMERGVAPVLYCPEIKGYEMPLVCPLAGSFEIIALALGCDPDRMTHEEIVAECQRRSSARLEPTWVPAADAPIKEVKYLEDQVDLGILPILHNSKLDGGKYIGAGFMISKWPDTGVINAGVYRHMVMGKDRLGAMINPGNDGAYIARRYAELGQMMEVALVIGHHPAVYHAACSKANPELDYAGGYLGEPLEIVRGETVDLPVPAQAEIVIEGIIDPNEWATDGPYAEGSGYYGHGNKPCYVIHVKAITMRHDAIYHHVDSDHPEHGHRKFGMRKSPLGSEPYLFEKLKGQFPNLHAVTRGWLGTYVSIKQQVPGEARQAALVAVAENYVTNVIVVDDDIDIEDEHQVMWAISTRLDPAKDQLILPWVKGRHLHPVSYDETGERGPVSPMTTHWILDATKPVTREFEVVVEPDEHLWATMKLEDYISP